MYGGQEVWPSGDLQVLVLISILVQDSDFKFRMGTCSGTLITPSWVLTAAHCFPEGTLKILLRFGGRNAQGHWKCVKEGRKVAFYSGRVLKEDFMSVDLAMVEVAKCSNGPKPIKMYRGKEIGDLNCTITGFGFSTGEDEYSRSWKPDALNQLCVGSSDLSFVIPGRILLRVGANGHGPCMGDSGGPLICNGDLYGVLSQIVHRRQVMSNLCGWPNGTVIYEDVANYTQWIEKVISTENRGQKCVNNCPFILIVLCVILVCEYSY